MPHFQIKTPSEQMAVLLREQILAGRYRGLMPGTAALAKELGTAPEYFVCPFEYLNTPCAWSHLIRRNSPHKGILTFCLSF